MKSRSERAQRYFQSIESLDQFVKDAELDIDDFARKTDLSLDQARDALRDTKKLIERSSLTNSSAASLEPESSDPTLEFADWRIGEAYFLIEYCDEELLVPVLTPVVFLGYELNAAATHAFFQSAESYMAGIRVRAGATDNPELFMSQSPPEGMFSFDTAMRELAKCRVRRALKGLLS